MILRRLTEHVRTQNWFAVALDFLIVVVGVFIGIQLGNWNEARQNRALAADYLDRLAMDIALERDLWGHAIDYFETAAFYADIALDGFGRQADELDEDFLIAVYQASQVWFAAPNRSTFDELQSTGRITIVSDADLRTALANHYKRSAQTEYTMSQTSQYRRIARLHLTDEVQEAVRQNCGDRWVTDERNAYYVALPRTCELDLDPALVADAIASVRGNEEVRRELRFHASVLSAQLGTMGNAIQTAEQTLERLEAAR